MDEPASRRSILPAVMSASRSMRAHSTSTQYAGVSGFAGSNVPQLAGTEPPEPGVSSTAPARCAMPPDVGRMVLATARPRRTSGTSKAMNSFLVRS
jgi:hypothetical protein